MLYIYDYMTPLPWLKNKNGLLHSTSATLTYTTLFYVGTGTKKKGFTEL